VVSWNSKLLTLARVAYTVYYWTKSPATPPIPLTTYSVLLMTVSTCRVTSQSASLKAMSQTAGLMITVSDHSVFYHQLFLKKQTKQYKFASEFSKNWVSVCVSAAAANSANSTATPTISTIISTPTPSPSQASQSNIILQSASTSATAPLSTSQAATTATKTSITASAAPSTPSYTSIQTKLTQVGHLS
jgi:hypothetical protein